MVFALRVEGIGRRAEQVPALVQRRRHLVAEAGIVRAGQEAVEFHRILLRGMHVIGCPSRPARASSRSACGEMQPLDHPAVERDHALADIFRQREGGDDRAGLGQRLRRSGEKALFAGSIWRDGSASCRRNPSRRPPRIRARRRPASLKSLLTPSSAASPPARAASTICISQRHEIAAVGRRADAGVLDEVVGSGDETVEPRRRVAAELGDGRRC